MKNHKLLLLFVLIPLLLPAMGQKLASQASHTANRCMEAYCAQTYTRSI